MGAEQLNLDFWHGDGGSQLSARTQPGISSGFADLDGITGGFRPGQLIVVGGAPGAGRTSFLLNTGYNIASARAAPVAGFFMEMSADEFAARLLSLGSMATDPQTGRLRGITFDRGNPGNLDEWEWSQLASAYNRLLGAPMYVDFSYPLDIETLCDRACRLAERRGIRLVLVDCLPLLSGDFRLLLHHRQIGRIARRLKQLAKELELTVIVAAQLSRSSLYRVRGGPRLTDIRGRTAVTYHADVVLIIHRPPADPAAPASADYRYGRALRDVDFVIAKNNTGATGCFQLRFHPEAARLLSAHTFGARFADYGESEAHRQNLVSPDCLGGPDP